VRLLALVALVLAGCASNEDRLPERLTGGNPDRGRLAVRSYGCVACHDIPGAGGARGFTGPPLTGLARRQSLAGLLPATADNLELWVRQPQRFIPGNTMPDLGVSAEDARDIAAFLLRSK
jgi:cytochrome c